MVSSPSGPKGQQEQSRAGLGQQAGVHRLGRVDERNALQCGDRLKCAHFSGGIEDVTWKLTLDKKQIMIGFAFLRRMPRSG